MGSILPIFYAIAVTIFILPKPHATQLARSVNESVLAGVAETKETFESARVALQFTELKENVVAFINVAELMYEEATGRSRVEKVEVAALAGDELISLTRLIESAPKPLQHSSEDFWNPQVATVARAEAACLAPVNTFALLGREAFTPSQSKEALDHDELLCLEPKTEIEKAPCCDLLPGILSLASHTAR